MNADLVLRVAREFDSRCESLRNFVHRKMPAGLGGGPLEEGLLIQIPRQRPTRSCGQPESRSIFVPARPCR